MFRCNQRNLSDGSTVQTLSTSGKIPIIGLARELGLNVSGYRAHCSRTENHRNGDANPSLSFQKKTNRGMCFVCDQHTWSTIDLVMLYRGCERREAVSWITARFSVPPLPKGAHIEDREAWSPRFRSSDTEAVLEMLVRSCLWRTLSHAERSILPVLATFASVKDGVAEISYRGLMRFSGVGSRATIAKALKHFEQMRLLEVVRAPGVRPIRRVNQYHFTLEDPGFQAMVAKIFQSQKEEIELEKAIREGERRGRKKQSPTCIGNTLFTQ